MKTKNLITIFLLAGLFLIAGCDNSTPPYKNGNGDIEESYPPNNGNGDDKEDELGNGNGNNEDDKQECKDGKVPYVSCPCRGEPIGTIRGISVLLLSPREDDIIRGDTVYSFYPASIRIPEEDVPFSLNNPYVVGWIFNLPDFAKQWESGVTVYYEGILYPLCCHFIVCRMICYNVVLTKLKIKEL